MCIFQDIPICAVFKAMGIESDQEIVQMIGVEEEVLNYFAATIEEGNMLQIYTKVQVITVFYGNFRITMFIQTK